MTAQQDKYTETSNTDYSAVRLKVENQARGFEVEDDKLSLSSTSEKAMAGNQNISSVLSQIQDDGPACASAVKADGRAERQTNNSGHSAENPHSGSVNNADAGLTAGTGLPQHARLNPGEPGSTIKNTTWLQLSLFLFVILTTAYYAYRLDVRTNQLEESLNVHETNIKYSIASRHNDLSPDLLSINQSLQTVKNELEIIKADKAPAVSNNQAVTVDEPVQIKQLAALKEEVVSLTAQLETANRQISEFKSIKIASSTDDKAAVKKELAGNGWSASGWIVNLASFTSKERTQKPIEKLTDLGYSPLIEEKVLNGAPVYRLIVAGFESRSEAELFKQIVAEQYGMKGGWIRKNG